MGTRSQKPSRKELIWGLMAVVMRCRATRFTYSLLFSSVTLHQYTLVQSASHCHTKSIPQSHNSEAPSPILTLLQPIPLPQNCSAHADADAGQTACSLKGNIKKHCHAIGLQMQGTRDIEKSNGSNPKQQYMRPECRMQRMQEQSQSPIATPPLHQVQDAKVRGAVLT